MSISRSTRRSGLTMIEVMIATVILSAIVAMSSWLVWSASTTVTTTEVNMKMEMDMREFVSGVAKELQQCKSGKVQAMNTAVAIPMDFKSAVSPGAAVDFSPWDPKDPKNLNGKPFVFADGIRFRIAGPMLELTAVSEKGTLLTGSGNTVKVKNPNTASADDNGKPDPNDPTGKKIIWNFNLQEFKKDNTKNSVAWLYEITYWWEVDKAEGKADSNSPSGSIPDGVDNNLNGVIDEGVVKKMETWFNPDGTVEKRSVSTVAKDVTKLQFTLPGWPHWVNRDPLINATVPNQYPIGSEKTVAIDLTMVRPDPRYPRESGRVIEKKVSATIDLRN